MDTKLKSFAMIFDEPTAHAFNLLLNMSRMYLEAHPNTMGTFTEEERDGISNLLETFSDKVHENKWCKDPNCKYDESHK